MKGMKFLIGCLALVLLAGSISAQSLHLDIQDLVLDTIYQEDGEIQGFMLYIRQKTGMQSVMLTETTRSADGMATNYAYRALEWNEINGDEQRMLDGQLLVSEYAKFSIIDSTPENHPTLGRAFCLYIPTQIQYGYQWSRNDIVQVKVGTFINVRTFGALYGDYSKGFEDNPFMFDLGESGRVELKTIPLADSNTSEEASALADSNIPEEDSDLTDAYNPVAVSAFDQIAKEVGGSITYSKGPETITDDILQVIQSLDPTRPTNIVFALDSTGSMRDDLARLRQDFIPRLKLLLEEFTAPVQLGLLLYRDYVDSYDYEGIPVKVYPSTASLEVFERHLFDFTIRGNEGGDVPEAVYEALYGSMDFYNWTEGAQGRVILIGDAEPHANPRGSKKYTKEVVVSTAVERGIVIDTIITPDGKTSADRK